MKADFSHFTYDERKHYQMVLMQQGRVVTEADLNEQSILSWNLNRCQARDWIGEHGGRDDAFLIKSKEDEAENPLSTEFIITKGRYYVNGIMCENDGDCLYTAQPHYPLTEGRNIQKNKKYLVYLCAWLLHITHLKDPDIRDPALGGPDTATRVQVVWQVKIKDVSEIDYNANALIEDKNFGVFEDIIDDETKPESGCLKAWAKKDAESEELCAIAPEVRYRGAENQLYRVEIHSSGPAFSSNGSDNENCATFKWSRDNGSVVFPIKNINGNTIILAHLGKDEVSSLRPGDWVEIVDEISELLHKSYDPHRIEVVDPVSLKVTLSREPDKPPTLINERKPRYLFLRRWDHKSADPKTGLIRVEEGKEYKLEDGIQIEFAKPVDDYGQQLEVGEYKYNHGDYWLIPARTATGNIEWSRDSKGNSLFQRAYKMDRHFAPLALITVGEDGTISEPDDLRRKFKQIWE